MRYEEVAWQLKVAVFAAHVFIYVNVFYIKFMWIILLEQRSTSDIIKLVGLNIFFQRLLTEKNLVGENFSRRNINLLRVKRHETS